RPPPPALAREVFLERGRRTDPPFEALRAYAKGLSAVDAAERARLLRQALSLAPACDGRAPPAPRRGGGGRARGAGRCAGRPPTMRRASPSAACSWMRAT